MYRILHTADWHLRGLTRHKEYRNAFEIFFEKAKKIKPDMIFIAGDLWHTKTTNITPESIDFFAWIFNNLGKIASTHIILGNHDLALANDTRQDILSPIINAMNNSNIHLYKKSGVYPIHKDINLCVFSCFDKEGWNKVKANPNTINIASFHGMVAGCLLDNEMLAQKAEVELDFFKEYDLVLLGDIHKRQYLGHKNNKPYIAYPGSLIQQNYAEELTKGFLVWDINNKTDWNTRFEEVENQQPFLTLPWIENPKKTIESIDEKYKKLSGVRYKFVHTQFLSFNDKKQLKEELKSIWNAEEVNFDDKSVLTTDSININSSSIKKINLRNDSNSLISLYKEFIEVNKENYNLTKEQLIEAENQLIKYLTKIKDQEPDQTRDVVWSIKEIEFNNTFRYGENNKINFENLNGLVGIFGKNRSGKSSFFGSITYNLFNTTDRGSVKASQIINRNKKYCNSKIKINVSGTDYIITRETKKAETKKQLIEDKSSTTLTIEKIDADGISYNLNDDTRTDTDKLVRKLIGTPQDFFLTAFSNQGAINKFLDQGTTERKSILNRFLDLDIFEKMYKFVNDDLQIINGKLSSFQSVAFDTLIEEIQKEILDIKAEISSLDGKLEIQKDKLEDTKIWLTNNDNSDLYEAAVKLTGIQTSISLLESGVATNERKLKDITLEKEKLESIIDKNQKEFDLIDIVFLQNKNIQMEALNKKMQELSGTHKEQNLVLQTQEKSVKKLTVVPCGDQFPECMYIKDSHNDKKLIENQRKLVNDITQQLGLLTEEIKGFQQEKIIDKIKRSEFLKKELDLSKISLENLKLKYSSCLSLNEQNTEKLISFKNEENILINKISSFDNKEYEQKENQLKQFEAEVKLQERTRNHYFVNLGINENKLNELRVNKERYEILNTEHKLYESISTAFHRNGIPAIVLKTQLPIINAELSKILANVDFKIVLELSGNDLDVIMEDEHSRGLIELSSGAEKMITSLALRVALNNLSSLPKPDIFILDEGLDTLDDEHLNKVSQFLIYLKSFFKAIFIITHLPAIKEITDKAIEVQNNGTESKINVN